MNLYRPYCVVIFGFFFFSVNESVDLLACSRPDYEVVAVLRENGIANDGNRTAQLSLVPSIPLDQDGILFRENISLTILDLDSKDYYSNNTTDTCLFLGRWLAIYSSKGWLINSVFITNLSPHPPPNTPYERLKIICF